MNAFVSSTTRWVATLALALPAFAPAAEPEKPKQAPAAPKPPRLISQEDLEKRLNEPGLRLIDARPKAEYDKGHLPGAIRVDVKSLEDLFKSRDVADKSAWTQALAPLGIDSNSEVYIYDGARQHDSARVWWLLGYASVENVGLVDGGFGLWEKSRRPVVSEVKAVAAKEFPVKFHERRVLGRADVQAAAKGDGLQLLDARSAAEFKGEKKPANGGRAGHIPGAKNVEAYDLVDGEGRFLDSEAILKKLADAGIAKDKPVIAYSNGAGRASVATFALRKAGVHARVYVPGFADWAKDAKAEVVTGIIAPSRAN